MKVWSRKIAGIILAVCSVATFSTGCQSDGKSADFSNVRNIAELVAIQVYYHNVAVLSREADGILFNFGSIGYKKMWFEYSASIDIGIDINKVSITEPDADGVVSVTLPKAEILSEPNIDASSMSDPVTETGWFTGISAEEKTEALNAAQEKMRETVKGNASLIAQADERAKELLSNYVTSVGTALGKTYTVKWIDAP